jgi:hypothetical protein
VWYLVADGDQETRTYRVSRLSPRHTSPRSASHGRLTSTLPHTGSGHARIRNNPAPNRRRHSNCSRRHTCPPRRGRLDRPLRDRATIKEDSRRSARVAVAF